MPVASVRSTRVSPHQQDPATSSALLTTQTRERTQDREHHLR